MVVCWALDLLSPYSGGALITQVLFRKSWWNNTSSLVGSHPAQATYGQFRIQRWDPGPLLGCWVWADLHGAGSAADANLVWRMALNLSWTVSMYVPTCLWSLQCLFLGDFNCRRVIIWKNWVRFTVTVFLAIYRETRQMWLKPMTEMWIHFPSDSYIALSELLKSLLWGWALVF